MAKTRRREGPNRGDREGGAEELGVGLSAYTEALFAQEDELQREIRGEVVRRGFERMQVSAAEGKLLHMLCLTADARRVLEVGTLLGYSAIWMARALPPGGELITLEIDAERAQVARRFIERARLGGIVRVRVGAALALLRDMGPAASFDVFFIDADKENYVAYMEEATRLLRPKGILLADNAFWSGRVLDPEAGDADTRAIQEFNRRLAANPRYASTIIPVRDGLAMGVKL